MGDILGNMNDITSDIVEPNFDQSSDFDLCEALSRGCTALQEAIRYRKRAEVDFDSASDVISLTSEIESFDEESTDTDDSEDDESVNIYEEALNCEDYGHKAHRFTREGPRKQTTFHQVRKITIY